jgi:hypothetical protein
MLSLQGHCIEELFLYSRVNFKGASKNLLRTPIAVLSGAQNPHVLHGCSGFSSPSALLSGRS